MMGTRLQFSPALTGITTAKEDLRAQIAADVAAWEAKNGKVKTMPIVRPLSDKGSFNNQQKVTDAQKRVMAILRKNPNMMKGEAGRLCSCNMRTLETAARLVGYKFKQQVSITDVVEQFASKDKTVKQLVAETGFDEMQVRNSIKTGKLPFKKARNSVR